NCSTPTRHCARCPASSVTATRRSPSRLTSRNPNLKARIISRFHHIASLHVCPSLLIAHTPSLLMRFVLRPAQAIGEVGRASHSASVSNLQKNARRLSVSLPVGHPPGFRASQKRGEDREISSL